MRCWDKSSGVIAQKRELATILNLDPSKPTVSMTCLGRHGRWGNTLLQYIFLRAFALKHSLRYETPQWVGSYLLGRDPPLTHLCCENVILDRISGIHNPDNHFEWPVDPSEQRATYLEKKLGRNPFEIHTLSGQDQDHQPDLQLPFCNADLEGLFMVHTNHLSHFEEELRSSVKPTPDVQVFLKPAVKRLRTRGKTVVGIHLRRGDFTTSRMKQNFELIPPTSVYVNWLRSIWTSLEDPVLFVASDDINAVVPAFKEFSPVTSTDLHGTMPADMENLDLSPGQLTRAVDFFPDWHLLTQCDVLAISNSTFSFTASMFSDRGHQFVRPTFCDNELVPFDPWQSEPVLFLPPQDLLITELRQQQKSLANMDSHCSLIPQYIVLIYRYCRLLLVRASTCLVLQGKKSLIKKLFTTGFYFKPRVRYSSGITLKKLPKEP